MTTTVQTDDPYLLARAAAEELRERTGVATYDTALILGSGWVPAADVIGTASTEIRTTDLPGFPAPTVTGHHGKIRSLELDNQRALVFLGRTHLYEGKGVGAVVHGVRTALAAGCRTIVLTNAAGGLRPGMQVGQPILISDHLNMTCVSPIAGGNFIDLTDLYTHRLRDLAKQVDPSLAEGVYACMPGPHYETPAEIRMLRRFGADLVGMSTVLEAIAAREGGANVLGLSMVTNLAAGITGEPLDHEEVLAAGRESAERMGHLLADVIGQL
ncbi:MAG: purine-nucleoside phosphorylase [Sporichthyaceae bacterium]|nr:purine-nucleoside phosphorylase [Sporichthyaceae bacterium]